MPGLVELGGGAKTGGTGTDDSDLFSGAHFGGSGVTQPSSNLCPMIEHSIFLIVTGGALMPRTHEPSHGAGQTRP